MSILFVQMYVACAGVVVSDAVAGQKSSGLEDLAVRSESAAAGGVVSVSPLQGVGQNEVPVDQLPAAEPESALHTSSSGDVKPIQAAAGHAAAVQ